MKSNNDNNTSSGGNLLGLLGIAFIVLKLTGVINWSWWWVTVPFWGGLAVVAVILFVVVLVKLILD